MDVRIRHLNSTLRKKGNHMYIKGEPLVYGQGVENDRKK